MQCSDGGTSLASELRRAQDTYAECHSTRFAGSVITELTVGMGPAGELRYPAYPEGDGRWRFPGVGEFQCYDRYMLEDLRRCAEAVGQPDWCAAL